MTSNDCLLFPDKVRRRSAWARRLPSGFPSAARRSTEADAALGESLSRLCFEGPEDQLLLTENTQPAILAASVAAWRGARCARRACQLRRGAQPGRVLGARRVPVRYRFADALRTVRRRGRYMQEAVPRRRRCDGRHPRARRRSRRRACEEAVRELPGRVVTPANLNAPGQVVIAGHADAVARGGELAKARGAKRVIPLNVSAPFHCAADEAGGGAARAGAARAGGHRIRRFRSSPTSMPSRSARGADSIEALIRQVSAPVRWEEVVRRLAGGGRPDVRRARPRHRARGTREEDRQDA